MWGKNIKVDKTKRCKNRTDKNEKKKLSLKKTKLLEVKIKAGMSYGRLCSGEIKMLFKKTEKKN